MQGYFRKRANKWSYTIDVGLDPVTGKRKQKTKGGFTTKKEAQLAAAIITKELEEGTYVKEKTITFKDFAVEWLSLYEATGKVKVSTVRVRKHEIEALMPHFAKLQMKKITRKTYQDALCSLKEKYAHNTLKGINRTGKMIFEKAVELGVIKTDPTKYTQLPVKQETVEEIENQEDIPKFLEKDELALFLRTAEAEGLEMDYVIFLVLAYTGLRSGELLALKWTDINFETGAISITKTYYNPNNNVPEYQLLTPKTKASRRVIDVAPVVLTELEKHRAKQNLIKMEFRNTYYDKGFIFAKTKKHLGYPELIKTVERRMARLLKLAKLNAELTPHSFRHTHTSLLAEAGVDLTQIMERLGHTDDATTKNIYLHITKTMKKEASQKFLQLMEGL